jgi:hypothetical protein
MLYQREQFIVNINTERTAIYKDLLLLFKVRVKLRVGTQKPLFASLRSLDT